MKEKTYVFRKIKARLVKPTPTVHADVFMDLSSNASIIESMTDATKQTILSGMKIALYERADDLTIEDLQFIVRREDG